MQDIGVKNFTMLSFSMKKCCIIPDVNVIIDQFCTGKYVRDARSRELIEYCLENDRLVTYDALLRAAYNVAKDLRMRGELSKEGHRDVKDFMKRARPRRIDMGMLAEMDDIATVIEQMYRERGFTDECNDLLRAVALVPERYRGIARDTYSSQMDEDKKEKLHDGLAVPDMGDLRLLGFAVLMKREYDKVIVVSNDADIIGWEENLDIVKKIESKFGITTGTPSDILDRLRVANAQAGAPTSTAHI